MTFPIIYKLIINYFYLDFKEMFTYSDFENLGPRDNYLYEILS